MATGLATCGLQSWDTCPQPRKAQVGTTAGGGSHGPRPLRGLAVTPETSRAPLAGGRGRPTWDSSAEGLVRLRGWVTFLAGTDRDRDWEGAPHAGPGSLALCRAWTGVAEGPQPGQAGWGRPGRGLRACLPPLTPGPVPACVPIAWNLPRGVSGTVNSNTSDQGGLPGGPGPELTFPQRSCVYLFLSVSLWGRSLSGSSSSGTAAAFVIP